MGSDTRIRKAEFHVCTVPTDAPEGDGTFEWNSTTMVLTEFSAADQMLNKCSGKTWLLR